VERLILGATILQSDATESAMRGRSPGQGWRLGAAEQGRVVWLVAPVGGSWIISAAVDGEYDKTGLPDPLILTYYFTLAGDQIASLIIVGNKPGY
jgi:hypothetical protein